MTPQMLISRSRTTTDDSDLQSLHAVGVEHCSNYEEPWARAALCLLPLALSASLSICVCVCVCVCVCMSVYVCVSVCTCKRKRARCGCVSSAYIDFDNANYPLTQRIRNLGTLTRAVYERTVTSTLS
jgi:hypothetical protein